MDGKQANNFISKSKKKYYPFLLISCLLFFRGILLKVDLVHYLSSGTFLVGSLVYIITYLVRFLNLVHYFLTGTLLKVSLVRFNLIWYYISLFLFCLTAIGNSSRAYRKRTIKKAQYSLPLPSWKEKWAKSIYSILSIILRGITHVQPGTIISSLVCAQERSSLIPP